MLRRWLIMVSAVTLLGTVACSSESVAPIQLQSVTMHDPAMKFASDKGGAKVSGNVDAHSMTDMELTFPVVLVDRTVIEATEAGTLSAVDVTGAALWEAKSDIPGARFYGRSTPIIATMSGKKVVITTIAVSTIGQGTTADHAEIEVLAVDVTNGQKVWSMELPLLSESREQLDLDPGLVSESQVVSVDDHEVVVSIFYPVPQTWIIDPATHQVRWQEKDFTATARFGDVVVGIGSSPGSNVTPLVPREQVVARAVTDGAVRWAASANSSRMTVSAASPGLIAVNRHDYYLPTQYFELFDAATGAIKEQIEPPLAYAPHIRCFYDEASVTVCGATPPLKVFDDKGLTTAIAYDAVTGQQIWSLPDPANNRLAPIIAGAWHGAIYGKMPEISGARNFTDKMVILDAKTGVDRETAPGIAPRLINGYAGVTIVYDEPRKDIPVAAHAEAFLTTG